MPGLVLSFGPLVLFAMALSNGITEEEKVRARAHMGYLNVAEAYTFVLGTPAAVETQFLIEGAWSRVLVSAVPLFREYLATLDDLENEMKDGFAALQANRVGQIEIARDHMKQLSQQYDRWVGKLANLLGCPPNPFDKSRGLGGVNVPVIHR